MHSRCTREVRDDYKMRSLLASLLLALCHGATGAPQHPKLVVSDPDASCDVPAAAAALEDRSLTVNGLKPGTIYLLEIQESGIDILIDEAPPNPDARRAHGQINSEPVGYALEPVERKADGSGRIRLDVDFGKRFSWAHLDIAIRCVGLPDASVDPQVRARIDIAQALAVVHSGADQDTARAALSALISIQIALLDRSTAADRSWLLFQLGSLAQHGGFSAAEQFWFAQAAQHSESMGDKRGEVRALRMVASAKLRTGQADADAAFADVQDRALRLDMPDLLASVSFSRCILKRVAGDAAGAALCYDESAEDFRALGDVMGESTAARSKATALLYLGRYDEAQESVDRALILAESIANQDLIVRARIVLAQLARWSGDFERSLGLLQSAYSIEQQTGQQNDLAKLERIIANTYELADEPARAEHYYLASLARTSAKGNELVNLDTTIDFASMLSRSGQLQRALDALNPALAQARGKVSAMVLADAALLQAATLLALSRRDEAMASLQAGEDGLESLHWRQKIRWQALQLRLGANEDAGTARAALSSAVARALVSGDLTLAMDAAEVLVELRIDDGNIEAGLQLARDIVRRGITTASRVRSPSLRNSLLSRLKWFAAVPMVTLPADSFDSAPGLTALAHLEALRAVEQSPFFGSGSDNATLELERVLASERRNDDSPSPERESLILAITSEDARRETPPGPQAESRSTAALFPDPVLTLTKDESLIYVVLSGPQPGVLTFSGSVARWRAGLDALALGKAVRQLESRLRAGHSDREEIQVAVSQGATALDWDQLLPAGTKRLYVVADGDLAVFPWGLLPTPWRPDEPIVESVELVSLQSLRAEESAMPGSLNIIAATSPVGTQLDSLANSDAEVASVRMSWAMLAPEATVGRSRAAMLDALARENSLIHVVAHGVADRGLLEDSGLWLTGEDGEPEFVSAFRLRRSNVNAALVVLGACESGVSRANRSLGIGGVAGSLVDAGSAAVVATRWPVSDRVAAEFAKSFHARLAADPSSPEMALAESVRALRRSPFARHPNHWAGWFLLRAGRESSESAGQ